MWCRGVSSVVRRSAGLLRRPRSAATVTRFLSDFMPNGRGSSNFTQTHSSSSTYSNLTAADAYNFQRLLMSPDPLFLYCYSPRDPKSAETLQDLNQLATKGRDKCVFATLNVEDNMKIAQMIGLSEVPLLIAIKGGQAMGSLPGYFDAVSVTEFIEQLHLGFSLKSEADAFESILSQAKELESVKDITGAAQLYSHIMNIKTDEVVLDDLPKFKARAIAGLARVALLEKNREAAEDIVQMLHKDYDAFITSEPDVASALFSVGIYEEIEKSPYKSVSEAEKALHDNEKDIEARYFLGVLQLSSGNYEEGIDTILTVIRKDRRWNDQAPKNLLMQVFSTLGSNHPLAIKGRRRLANILF